AGRLTPMHGQILLTMGIIWMWLASPSRETPDSVHKPDRKRIFFCLDWSGRLKGVSSIGLRIMLLVGPLLIAFAISRLSVAWLWIDVLSILTVLMPIAIAVEITRRVGVADAERFIASTLVIAVVFGLGIHAIRRMDVLEALWWYFNTPLDGTIPTVVMGVSVLRASAISVLAIGLLLLLRPPRTSVFALSLACLALVGTGLAVLVTEPTGRIASRVLPVIEAIQVEPQPPQFEVPLVPPADAGPLPGGVVPPSPPASAPTTESPVPDTAAP
ncbi:MAG: hypothetical protein ACOC0P_04495, partial [Planctomycetota bacterium]